MPADGGVCFLVPVRLRGTVPLLWLFGCSGFSQTKSCFVDGAMMPAVIAPPLGRDLQKHKAGFLREKPEKPESQRSSNHLIVVLDLSGKTSPTG